MFFQFLRSWFVAAAFFSGALSTALALDPQINEFVANNKTGLSDEDGDESDWIELYNPNPVAMDLTGWFLTDDLQVPNKWPIPAVSINGRGYLVIFASGKDRRVPTGTLHTNFGLSAGGNETVALVKPDGVTVVSQIPFTAQPEDVSYGPASVTSSTETLISDTATVRALVPPNGTLGTTWTTAGFNDSTWASGPWAVGYENSSGYESLIGLDVKASMLSINRTCYIRVPFNVSSLTDVVGATLSMRYDDGFAVYLNGNLLPNASRHQPAVLAWNSGAAAENPDSEAVQFEDIDLTEYLSFLQAGSNILAVHGLNIDLTSSDFLIGGKLAMTRGTKTLGFMTTPTPGTPNGTGTQGFVADTKFSVDRGFYTAPFTVTITCSTPGAVIRYTRNGNAPTENTGFVYAGPVAIDATTILRAAAFKPGFLPSNVDTQSYFFLEDIIRQSTDGSAPTGWPGGSVNGQVFNYGMDPNVVTGREATIKAALQAIPTVSLVTDLPNLIDSATGIYVNPGAHGSDWERPVSLEIINDSLNPSVGGFQQNAGIRIRGGFSRDPNNPKHSLRLFFRSSYGKGKMNYAFFGNEGAAKFDNIDFRTSQDASWSYLGSSTTTFLRDELSRATQVATGNAASHVRYVHLYLNGQYWGLYDTDERPDASFGETYIGGKKEDYDVVKSAGSSGGYQTEATDGTMEAGSAWNLLWQGGRLVRTTPTNANYFKLMGKAADGVTPTADPILLDPANLADYMMVLFYTGCDDSAVSDYVGASNNWFGMRRRTGRLGFHFFVHDYEQTLGLESGTNQRVGSGANVVPWSTVLGNANDYARSNPEYLHEDLAPNAEYRLLFADRAHRLMYNNGPLSDAATIARLNSLAAIIDTAIWGESARWGDAQREPAYTRSDWVTAKNGITNFLTFGTTGSSGQGRRARVITQLRAYDTGSKPLYPTTEAPVFSQHGGAIPAGGTTFTISNPNTGSPVATIYYTLDGSDPRVVGGAVAAGATTYAGAIPLSAWTTTAKSRALKGTVWSALNEAVFAKPNPPLRISEVMPIPLAANSGEIAAGYTDKDDFEFVEITNPGPGSANVRDLRFTVGIDAKLPDVTLAAGERGLVVRNRLAFQARYGITAKILGEYVGSLDDDGETITLTDALGNILSTFSYDNSAPWPPITPGRSLTLRRTSLASVASSSWRATLQPNGTPGTSDAISYAAWKAARGIVNESSDGDGDGLLPLAEFAVGGSATGNDQARLPRVAVVKDANGQVTHLLYTYTRGPGTDELEPVFETSSNFSTWTVATAEFQFDTQLLDGSESVQVKLPAPSGATSFVRMRWQVVP